MNYELLNEVCKPYKKHKTDAGMDLRSSLKINLFPQMEATIPLGIKAEVPEGYAALLIPRSGLGSRGLELRNTVGVIDTDYRGQWIAKVKNNSENARLDIEEGTRIIQCVIVPVYLIDWVMVDKVNETERGEGGFGHTGTK
ncbi:MAG: dUTP diphosphatase [Desulfobacteraceae bacterium]|nr:dUTP diphosphatase [Desulfobacteraceae bacterium]